ncbi:oxidoreductase [Roseomonas hellenica]|uniref:Oxidoreductase n=1 Tax=Plastoroseomonas hellenica TaxID=2687306 RepID=A0ABS5F1L4_9PROT|nr:PDR/VanB family oxidoreductase [Plastoroseomonas hellenica]MBR0666421.1 oxidoreductase [Plastoroseomonas hellenica]
MPRHITLRVVAAAEAGPGIRRLTLQDPDGWRLPRVRPGAHLDLQVPGVGPRAYSLCGDPAEEDRWVIAVRREATSRGGSAWLHEALRPGDMVASAMPRCTFPLEEAATHHVMIAGGIGVTPFLSMAPMLERAGRSWVLHVLHRGGPPPCGDDLAPWAALGRVVLHDTLSAPRPDLATLLGPHRAGIQAYCCGPPAMLEGFAAATIAWPAGAARMEHFVPPALPPDPDARPYLLVRAATGESVEVAAGESMLAALRRMGANVDSSCEGGICGACEIRWLEGEPIHRDLVLPAARRATHLMACVAHCASARLVVEA